MTKSFDATQSNSQLNLKNLSSNTTPILESKIGIGVIGRNESVNLERCLQSCLLFFEWSKQHLRVKAFFGASENVVKAQIWIALAVYVLVAIVKNVYTLKRVYTKCYES